MSRNNPQPKDDNFFLTRSGVEPQEFRDYQSHMLNEYHQMAEAGKAASANWIETRALFVAREFYNRRAKVERMEQKERLKMESTAKNTNEVNAESPPTAILQHQLSNERQVSQVPVNSTISPPVRNLTQALSQVAPAPPLPAKSKARQSAKTKSPAKTRGPAGRVKKPSGGDDRANRTKNPERGMKNGRDS